MSTCKVGHKLQTSAKKQKFSETLKRRQCG